MIRTGGPRVDAKRRADIDYKKRQFATPAFAKNATYPHRMSMYTTPPTSDVSLEDFEGFAIARLKVLSELETCSFRNRSADETLAYMTPVLAKHLPLHSNGSRDPEVQAERRRDHYAHFILRLAFAGTEELRKRFSRLETGLFRLRMRMEDGRERRQFVEALDMEWEMVGEREKAELGGDVVLLNGAGVAEKGRQRSEVEEEGWFKVEWGRVPELVEQRRVLVRKGMAYVPAREQIGLVVNEFTKRLDDALEITARALPRLDEDDRLSPILTHLSTSFTTPDTQYDASELSSNSSAFNPTASTIPLLTPHMPPCMLTLHTALTTSHHLKHFSRLQYTLFLKGLSLPLDQAILFLRNSFYPTTPNDKFDKEYRYNIRHAYGDVGGDANRRGRGYSPYSCQKLHTEPLPGPGQDHGCPFRTYSPENLTTLLSRSSGAGGCIGGVGVRDDAVLRAVREDVKARHYHVACNRVFEHVHGSKIDKAKREKGWGVDRLDTLLHPNAWFARSWALAHLDDDVAVDGAGQGDGEGGKRVVEYT